MTREDPSYDLGRASVASHYHRQCPMQVRLLDHSQHHSVNPPPSSGSCDRSTNSVTIRRSCTLDTATWRSRSMFITSATPPMYRMEYFFAASGYLSNTA